MLLVKLYWSSCFKALYENNNKQLLLSSALCIAYHEQKVDKNAML